MSAVGRKPAWEREIRARLRILADEHPERWARACALIAHAEGWECVADRRVCVNMVRQALQSRPLKTAARRFDADWLLIVADQFPELGLGALFTKREAVAEAKRELSGEAA